MVVVEEGEIEDDGRKRNQECYGSILQILITSHCVDLVFVFC